MPYSKDQLKALVVDYAYGKGIDAQVALAQIDRESAHFAENVAYGPRTGPSGERGLAQFMPATWARFGYGSFDNAFNPDLNLWAWSEYMKWLLDRYDWDYEKALQGYNGGEGNVDRGTVSAGAQRYAREVLAKAGIQVVPNVPPGDPGIPLGYPDPPESDFPTPLLIGGLALILILALK